jgi:hypothetical protein
MTHSKLELAAILSKLRGDDSDPEKLAKEMSLLKLCYEIQKIEEEKEKMEGAQVPFRKNYDENDDCRFETLDSISKCNNLWPMIRSNVITNSEFTQAIATTHWTPFNLRD